MYEELKPGNETKEMLPGLDSLCRELGEVKYRSIPKITPIGVTSGQYLVLVAADMGIHDVVVGESKWGCFIALKANGRIRVYQLRTNSIYTCRHGYARYGGPFTGVSADFPITNRDLQDFPLAKYLCVQKDIRATLVALWVASGKAKSGGGLNLLRELESRSMLAIVLRYLHKVFE